MVTFVVASSSSSWDDSSVGTMEGASLLRNSGEGDMDNVGVFVFTRWVASTRFDQDNRMTSVAKNRLFTSGWYWVFLRVLLFGEESFVAAECRADGSYCWFIISIFLNSVFIKLVVLVDLGRSMARSCLTTVRDKRTFGSAFSKKSYKQVRSNNARIHKFYYFF